MTAHRYTRAHQTSEAISPIATGLLQRKCTCGQHTSGGAECSGCKKRHREIQRAGFGQALASPPPLVHNVLRTPGRPLENTDRDYMERSFSRDFSNVRVHTDKMAQDSASAIGARAYTSGSDIVFGSSEYDPGTSSGRWLLAHELTHVVQQSGRPSGPNLTVGPSGGSLEAEADNVANRIIRNTIPGSLMQDELQPDREAANLQASPTISQADVGNVIQMLPAPPSGSTYRYCGFGLDTNVPDFVKSHFNGTYNINYTTGCRWIALHAWSSLWELYDASDTRIDSNRRTPYGSYNITGSNIASGTPSDGSALWSLWYQVDRSQPWLTGDPDAYPHDYDTFHVYENPIRNPRTTLQEEVGPIVWQDNFTPAEDGAILQYNFSASATRSTTDSQTTTTSVTVGGQQSSNIGFEFEGLSGGFSRSLNFSATQSISRTHSVSVSETQSLSRNFTQPNLQGGVTYSVKMRPLYHLVDGSVDQISHRNGVVTGTGATLTGAIRVLKGMDLAITSSARSGGPGSDAPGSGTQARPWHCTASCNVEGTEPQCQNKRATGRGSGPNQNEACKAAKRDANNSVPSGCYKRHCQCDCSQ